MLLCVSEHVVGTVKDLQQIPREALELYVCVQAVASSRVKLKIRATWPRQRLGPPSKAQKLGEEKLEGTKKPMTC